MPLPPGEGPYIEPKTPNKITSNEDTDSPAFRENSLSPTHIVLQRRLDELKDVMKNPIPESLVAFIISAADEIDRTVVGAGALEDISAIPESGILHQTSGTPLWLKPNETTQLEAENMRALTEAFTNGQIDLERLSKGVYFSEVLLHKYKNGNGRTARAMKMLFDKSRDTNGDLTVDDTKKVLGIKQEELHQTDEHILRFNISPDFDRLRQGVAYFGLSKGLTENQALQQLNLNGTSPEKGLQTLAKHLGVFPDSLKEDFIRFMVVDADLSWCNFDDKS